MTQYTASLERLLLEGEALVKARRYDEGEQRAHAVLAQQPRNAAGHYILALSSLMQERHAEALPHVESALRTDRVNAQFHFMAALCHAGLGRPDQAMASYRRALQYRPDFFEARANLGYLLECAGMTQDAVACYRRVLAEHPQEFYSLNRLAYCERVMGNAAAAMTLLDRALEMQPEFAPAHNERGLALLQLWRKPEAIAAFRSAVALDPGFLFAWGNLGKVLYLDYVVAPADEADRAPVLECFERILELDPENVEFAYLRDCVSGVKVARPPDEYIARFFDRFAPQYEEKVTGELEYAGPRAAAELLGPWLAQRSGLSVLDLGCGTGLSGGFLRAAASRLVGVDLSGAMLERARERGIYDEVVQAEIGAFLEGLEGASIDLAVALEVFNYVGELERVLLPAARALAPGGRLLCSIEEAKEGDLTLAASGRYAHSRAYVEATARAAGLIPAEASAVSIRREAGVPVPAWLLAFDQPGA